MNSKDSFITLPKWHRMLLKAMTIGMICFFVFAVALYMLYDPGEAFDRHHYIHQFIVIPTAAQIIIIALFATAVAFVEKHVTEWIMTIILSICMTSYLGVMVAVHNSVHEMAILLIYPIFGATIYNNRVIMILQGAVSTAAYVVIETVIVPNMRNFEPVNTALTYLIIFVGLTGGAVIISFMLRQVSLDIIASSIIERDILRNAVKTDQMTGLYNHSSFHEMLDQKSAEQKQKFSIIIVDIDNFKRVNDTFGHAMGDKIILNAVDVIKHNIRNNDLAFRYGGEEFVIIVDNASEDTALAIGERIVSLFNKIDNGAEFNHESFSLSAGVAEFGKHDENKSLFEAADEALYFAKGHGKNRCVKYSEIV